MNRSYIIVLLVTAALCILVISRHLAREDEPIASSQLRRPWQKSVDSTVPPSRPLSGNPQPAADQSPVLSRRTTSLRGLASKAVMGDDDRVGTDDKPMQMPRPARRPAPAALTTRGDQVRGDLEPATSDPPAGRSRQPTDVDAPRPIVRRGGESARETATLPTGSSPRAARRSSDLDRTPVVVRRTLNAGNDTSPRPAETVATYPSRDRYLVQPGDTFTSIAVTVYGEHQRWIDLKEANPSVNPKALKPGQILNVPSITNRPSTVMLRARKISTYTIRPGDTLSSIAARHCGSSAAWNRIYSANRRVIGSDPDVLTVGTRLEIDTKP